MPTWCPECNAMLTEGTAECPRCGAQIETEITEGEFSSSDIAWFSAYSIAIIVIPIFVGVGIALLCLFIFFIRN